MLRSVGAYILAGVLVLLSRSAFLQVPNEFRDTEPGSLLFGVLQLVIGTSAVVAAVGLVKRARWAAPAIGIFGIAASALLIAQPLFEPMDSDAAWSIWLAAGLVGATAAGVAWFARHLARHASAARAARESARVQPTAPAPALLPDARLPAEPIVAHVGTHAPHEHVPRVESTQRHDDPRQASRAPIQE
jgi:multidrug transporter EmrE-like cation transporter